MKAILTVFLLASSSWVLANGVPHAANTYDINNRLTQVTYNDGRQVTYTYDAMGNITSVKTKTEAPPVVLVGSPILGAVGHPITDHQIQSNRPGDVTGYVLSGLPKGLKVNTKTVVNADGKGPGVIYGTPNAGGTFSIKVSLKSASGTSAPAIIPASIDTPFSTIEDGFNLTGGFSGAIDPSAIAGADLGGWLTIKTTATGAFSGTLQIGALKYAFKGAFDGATGATPSITIVRKTPLGNLTLDLTLGLTGNFRGQVTGTLADGSTTIALELNREIWSTKNPAMLFSGTSSARYNVVIDLDPVHVGDNGYPQGFGYASFTVNKTGSAKLAGKLADGTPVTLSKIIWPNGTLPLFIPLYASKGVINGFVTLGQGSNFSTTDNPADGQGFWKRPVSTKVGEKIYAAGFETTIYLTGGAYTPPGKGYRILDLGNGISHPLVSLELGDGGLASMLTTHLTLSTTNKVTAFAPNDHGYALVFTPATGIYSGRFAVDTPARKPAINGLVVPDMTAETSSGFGFFLLPGVFSTDPTLSGYSWIYKP